jgi:hypothetical protein
VVVPYDHIAGGVLPATLDRVAVLFAIESL